MLALPHCEPGGLLVDGVHEEVGDSIGWDALGDRLGFCQARELIADWGAKDSWMERVSPGRRKRTSVSCSSTTSTGPPTNLTVGDEAVAKQRGGLRDAGFTLGRRPGAPRSFRVTARQTAPICANAQAAQGMYFHGMPMHFVILARRDQRGIAREIGSYSSTIAGEAQAATAADDSRSHRTAMSCHPVAIGTLRRLQQFGL